MPDPKRAFIFGDEQHVKADIRAANALEFIAYYLDRIEGHLERLSNAQTVGSLEGIRMELTGVVEFLKRLEP